MDIGKEREKDKATSIKTDRQKYLETNNQFIYVERYWIEKWLGENNAKFE